MHRDALGQRPPGHMPATTWPQTSATHSCSIRLAFAYRLRWDWVKDRRGGRPILTTKNNSLSIKAIKHWVKQGPSALIVRWWWWWWQGCWRVKRRRRRRWWWWWRGWQGCCCWGCWGHIAHQHLQGRIAHQHLMADHLWVFVLKATASTTMLG